MMKFILKLLINSLRNANIFFFQPQTIFYIIFLAHIYIESTKELIKKKQLIIQLLTVHITILFLYQK